jgi:hypothetical protein
MWAAIDADPATDELDVWLDDVLVTQLRGASGWQSIVTSVDPRSPTDGQLSIRFVRGAGSSIGAGTAWIDDLAFEAVATGTSLCR